MIISRAVTVLGISLLVCLIYRRWSNEEDLSYFDSTDDMGRTVFTIGRDETIWIVKPGQRRVKVGLGAQPSISSAGTVVGTYRTSAAKFALILYSADYSSHVLPVDEGLGASQPIFSPSGDHVDYVLSHRVRSFSFGGSVPADFCIARTDLKGNSRPLFKKSFFSIYLRPGADDTQTVFFSGKVHPGDPSFIYSVSLDGKHEPRRIAPIGDSQTVTTCQYRNLIAFTSREEGRDIVKLARKDGKKARTVLDVGAIQVRFVSKGRKLRCLLDRPQHGKQFRDITFP